MHDRQPLESSQNSVTVAIVAFDSLGDGLLFMVLAENLKNNGYAVTYYSDPIHQMKAWLPDHNIKPLPASENVENEFGVYDLVISDSDAISVITKQASAEDYPSLAQQYVFLSTKKIDPRLLADHSQRITRQFPESKHKQLLPLANSSGLIRDQSNGECNMVDHMLRYCQLRLGLKNVTSAVRLSAPPALEFRKYAKRVVIFPYSASAKKNWSPKQFIRFARLLEKSAWQPCFVVAPHDRDEWRLKLQGRFPLPALNDIHDLASLIYESSVVVANDSGGGHLASFLNIPVLTIYKKNNNAFSWSPGWNEGKVIRPLFTVKLFGKRIWRPFLPASRVNRAFNELIKRYI